MKRLALVCLLSIACQAQAADFNATVGEMSSRIMTQLEILKKEYYRKYRPDVAPFKAQEALERAASDLRWKANHCLEELHADPNCQVIYTMVEVRIQTWDWMSPPK